MVGGQGGLQAWAVRHRGPAFPFHLRAAAQAAAAAASHGSPSRWYSTMKAAAKTSPAPVGSTSRAR